MAVQQLVAELLTPGVSWIDMKGVERPLCLDDILIVAPYNAQVFSITDRLPNARVGTVRFNVATSRARCACILIGNPRLFEPDCKTPRQMKLANALCRYLALATAISQ
jgi:uncharacterized protein